MLLGMCLMLGACASPTEEVAPVDPSATSQNPTDNQVTTEITLEEAKQIALQHANLTEDQVSFIKADHDFDDGIEKYDVEFYMDNKEYDYEIHTKTGEIISYDHDVEDDNATDIKPGQSAAKLSEGDAHAIVLKHANLTSEQVKFSHTDYEVDHGVEKYDIEFYMDNVEYNYEIDANTGEIIGYEKN